MQIEAETHFHINSRARISYHYQCEDSILQNDHTGPLHNIDSWTFEHISFLGPFFSPHHANGGVQ